MLKGRSNEIKEYVRDILLCYSADSVSARASLNEKSGPALEKLLSDEVSAKFRIIRSRLGTNPVERFQITENAQANQAWSELYLLNILETFNALKECEFYQVWQQAEHLQLNNELPENEMDFFAAITKASAEMSQERFGSAYRLLKQCRKFLLTRSDSKLNVHLAALGLECGRNAGMSQIALADYGDLQLINENTALNASYHRQMALTLESSRASDALIKDAFESAIVLTKSAGSIRSEDIECMSDYICYLDKSQQQEFAAQLIDRYCSPGQLTEKSVAENSKFPLLLNQILTVFRELDRETTANYLETGEQYFQNTNRKSGRSYRQFSATKSEIISNKEGEDAVLNSPSNLIRIGGRDYELVLPGLANYKINMAIKTGKINAKPNVKIRGLSADLAAELGLPASLTGEGESQEYASELDKYLEHEWLRIIHPVGEVEEVDPDRIHELSSLAVQSSFDRYQSGKDEKELQRALRSIELEIQAGLRRNISGNRPIQKDNAIYDTYLKLQSEWLRWIRLDEMGTRAGTDDSLRSARQRFVDFLTGFDNEATAQIEEYQSLNIEAINKARNIFIYYEANPYIYVIGKIGDRIEFFRLDKPEDFEKKLNFVLKKGMDMLEISNDTSVLPEFAAIRKEWYKLLVENIFPLPGEEVLIVPVGKMALVNWEYLDNSNNMDYHPIIHDYNIHYELSISDLNKESKQAHEEVSFAGFTSESYPDIPLDKPSGGGTVRSIELGPLAGAAEEVSEVGDLYEGEIHLKTTPELFLDNWKNNNVVLISTHGILLPQGRDVSTHLIFERNSNDDFAVNESDILGGWHPAQLVSMPSCNSALGEVSESGGLVSLARAFLTTGTEAVTASLHELPDKSTSEISRSFFRYLRAGDRKSVALRKAKLDFLQKFGAKKAEPVFWSGLMLMGSDAPLSSAIKPKENDYFYTWIFTGSILILAVFIAFQIRKIRNRKFK